MKLPLVVVPRCLWMMDWSVGPSKGGNCKCGREATEEVEQEVTLAHSTNWSDNYYIVLNSIIGLNWLVFVDQPLIIDKELVNIFSLG